MTSDTIVVVSYFCIFVVGGWGIFKTKSIVLFSNWSIIWVSSKSNFSFHFTNISVIQMIMTGFQVTSRDQPFSNYASWGGGCLGYLLIYWVLKLLLSFSFSVTFLGKLDTWNVNYAEVEEIRSEIRSCNMDLELWETFDSFDREDAMENFIRMNREMDQLGMVEQVEQ